MRRVECVRVMTNGNYSSQHEHKDRRTGTGTGKMGPSPPEKCEPKKSLGESRYKNIQISVHDRQQGDDNDDLQSLTIRIRLGHATPYTKCNKYS